MDYHHRYRVGETTDMKIQAPQPRRNRRPAKAAAIMTVLGLAAAGGGWSGTATASAAPTTTVTIGVYAGNLLSAEVAEANGYFAKEHINAELKTLQAGPAIVAATESGSVDIGVGDTLAWAAAVGNGFSDLDLLAASTMQTPALGSDEHLVAAKGITSPSQLSGKTIGYIPYPEMTVATKLWLQKHGVDPSSVKFITISDGTQVSLLEKGGADVVEGRNEGENEQIAKSAGGVDLGEVFGVLPDDTINVSYFAKKSWLSKNKTVDEEVATALNEGAAFNRTAPATTLAGIATKYAGFNYAALSKQYPGIIQKTDWYREAPPTFTPKAISATNQWIADAVKEGQVKKAFNITPYLWPTATSANGG
jgi:ABC-type nitrate/sulfonate/bicarbonate transport system substrate-binding protein